MAGFETSALGNYYLPRAKIQPPESLYTQSGRGLMDGWTGLNNTETTASSKEGKAKAKVKWKS
jgi:hypothetical protein